MTSFANLPNYASYLVLLAGLTWLAGVWGIGRALCAGLNLRLPAPWSAVVAVLLGIQLVCLVVQVLGMTGLASKPALISLWGLVVVVGGAVLLIGLRRRGSGWELGLPAPALPLAIISMAAVAGLVVALAPSTKIDEIYYHMLVPGRIVLDGAMQFYRAPWVAAIWPQLAYEVSSTPLHAIGYPDAPNVVSWALGVMLLGFSWRVMRGRGASPYLAAVTLGALCVGLYPVVWYGNAGAHAMGDLAMTAAIISYADRERLTALLGRAAFAAMTSILLLSAVTSKVSLVPVCLLLLGLSVWPLLRSVSWAERVLLGCLVAMPWIIFYLPILIWTWVQSGSPFGPMMAGHFGASIYSLEKIQAILRHARDGFQPSFGAFAFSTAVNYSPLVWLGLVGLVGADLPRNTRMWLALIFIMQCGLIYFLLPHEARFLGGMQFGLLIVAAMHAGEAVKRAFAARRAPAIACVIVLIPWNLAQLYYAQRFLPVVLGLEREAFYRRYVAYFDDFKALDKILPANAVLLAAEGHTSAAYAPRAIFFNALDVPKNRQPFLFVSSAGPGNLTVRPYHPCGLLYENDQAKIVTYRTERPPIRGALQVRYLLTGKGC